MTTTRPSIDELFEHRMSFPDVDAKDRLSHLVGIDNHKARLAKLLGILVNQEGLKAWGRKHHPNAGDLLSVLSKRPPLIVLAGDVGSGKTELAETIGDQVARQEEIEITLFPLSLSARGQGRVGEMTQLLSGAFDHVVTEASKLKSASGAAHGGIILLVDEADALAQSREATQMHHEDRAGVNAFIRGIDRISNRQLPAAVIMCTNRLGALDPAIKRRAADILIFERPNDMQRHTVIAEKLAMLGLSEAIIKSIIAITGPQNGRAYGFTFSDLTQRLLPAIVLDAYPDRPVDAQRAFAIAQSMIPTPPFREATT
jgi:SpoVK/Ycf46/Vps4 family AAA+-type ATPase